MKLKTFNTTNATGFRKGKPTIRNDCQATGVPFFFKQWGQFIPVEKCQVKKYPLSKLKTFPGFNLAFASVGKTKAGNYLDGKQWLQLPNQIKELNQDQ